MPKQLSILLVVVAAVLIVVGRLNHKTRYGNWVAMVGYALLAVVGVLILTLGAG